MSSVNVDGIPVFARASLSFDEIALLRAGSPVFFERRHLADGIGDVFESRTPCFTACRVSNGNGPVDGPSAWAVAIPVGTPPSTVVTVFPHNGGAEVTSERFDLELPAIASDASDLRVVGIHANDLVTTHVSWDAHPIGSFTSLGVTPVAGTPPTLSIGGGHTIVAVNSQDTLNPGLVLLELSGEHVSRRTVVSSGLISVNSIALRISGDYVAVVWGDVAEIGQGGAHLAVYSLRDWTTVLPSHRLSVNEFESPNIVRIDVSPHPEGFTVVWNDIGQMSNYVLYGEVIHCNFR